MAKIDKEALKKNQFWIGLGVFVLIWLIGIIVVKAGGDDKPKKEYTDSKTKIENAKKAGPKTEAYQTPWKQHGAIFRKHKDTIWQQAWQQQASMYTWPKDMKVQPLYPQDPLGADPGTEVNNRASFRSDYGEQFEGLDTYVYPAEFNGGFEAVFPKQKWHPQRPPTREEIWLAQEDFWVRREMLIDIRTALDATALFHEVKIDPKEKLPAGVVGRRLFRNANWELELLFIKAENRNGWDISEESTIKNINVSRKTQALANPATAQGLPFVLIKGAASYVMRITGEPLAFEQKTPLKHRYSVQTVRLDKNTPDDPPLYVEQKLDWDISPIRRIDKLEVGKHSHRTVNLGLRAWDELKKLDPDTEPEEAGKTATGGTGQTSGSPPPTGMGKAGMAPPGSTGSTAGSGGGRGEAEAGPDITRVTEIPRTRYLQVTPQCRHLPIAMRMVVDQAHIHDVLAAVANSRLRIQITQVSILHVNDVKRGEAVPTNSDGGGSGGKTGGKPGTVPGSRPRPGSPMGGSRPPTGLMGPGSSPGGRGKPSYDMGGRGGSSGGPPRGSAFMPNRGFGALQDDRGPTRPPMGGTGGTGRTNTEKPQLKDSARLVELSIYGIASLYDRYPPRPQPDATPGTTTPTPTPTKSK